jgi:hypothetical protein
LRREDLSINVAGADLVADADFTSTDALDNAAGTVSDTEASGGRDGAGSDDHADLEHHGR